MQDEGTKFVFSATEQNALQLYMEKETKNHFLLMRKRVKYAITVLMPEKYKRNAAYVTTKIVNGLSSGKFELIDSQIIIEEIDALCYDPNNSRFTATPPLKQNPRHF